MESWVNLKGPVLSTHIFQSANGSAIALSSLVSATERNGSPCRRPAGAPGPCSAANLSFPIWYSYYLLLRTEQCCSYVVANRLDIALSSPCLIYALLLLWMVSLAPQARIFVFTLVIKSIWLIYFSRWQKLTWPYLKSVRWGDINTVLPLLKSAMRGGCPSCLSPPLNTPPLRYVVYSCHSCVSKPEQMKCDFIWTGLFGFACDVNILIKFWVP